jgi:CheY-like chemotaxis protein
VGKGSGLGLSQAYGFAKSSGGHLTIESRVGIGTSIKLYLPKSSQPTQKQSPAVPVVPMGGARDREETILIVEDDPLVLQLAVDALDELGYTVVTAADAKEALTILHGDGRVDVLFSDIVMPGGMNGLQLAVEARRVRPGIKVLLTSGYAAEALAAQGVPNDIEILPKPYRSHDIARHLQLV